MFHNRQYLYLFNQTINKLNSKLMSHSYIFCEYYCVGRIIVFGSAKLIIDCWKLLKGDNFGLCRLHNYHILSTLLLNLLLL